MKLLYRNTAENGDHDSLRRCFQTVVKIVERDILPRHRTVTVCLG